MRLSELQKVDGHNSLVRDPKSGAVLNINRTEAQRARQIKQMRIDKEKQDIKLREEVNELKSDVQDMKAMLSQIVEKLNG